MASLAPARLRSVPRPGQADTALALLLAAVGLVEVFLDPPAPLGAGVAAILLTALPLAWRAIAPVAVVAIGAASLIVASLLLDGDIPLLAYLTGMVGVYSLGEFGSNRALIIGGPIAVIGYASTGLGSYDIGDATTGALFTLAALGVGRAVRVMGLETDALEARTVVLERERDEQARVAVAEERERIARELHDVIGHSISVMGVQAGAVRRVLEPGQQSEREALLAIERTGRDAVNEMRRLLGLLRSENGAPSESLPTLARSAQLVADMRAAGLDVDFEQDGDLDDLPPGRTLAGFRILQEALTNALKHSPDAHVSVRLSRGASSLEIEVVQDGAAEAGGGEEVGDGDNRAGQGLVGMRERVALYGGELRTGPGPGGGYEVRASLPLQAGES